MHAQPRLLWKEPRRHTPKKSVTDACGKRVPLYGFGKRLIGNCKVTGSAALSNPPPFAYPRYFLVCFDCHRKTAPERPSSLLTCAESSWPSRCGCVSSATSLSVLESCWCVPLIFTVFHCSKCNGNRNGVHVFKRSSKKIIKFSIGNAMPFLRFALC